MKVNLAALECGVLFVLAVLPAFEHSNARCKRD
jgi:hypothetical protein